MQADCATGVPQVSRKRHRPGQMVAFLNNYFGWAEQRNGRRHDATNHRSNRGARLCDCGRVGELLGIKIVGNEFLAYSQLHQLQTGGPVPLLSPRSEMLATYALCGFANFGSIGIQIGGIGALAPSRRVELAQLGLRAMIGGALASHMTACVAGVLR